jgi:hypothetical protein
LVLGQEQEMSNTVVKVNLKFVRNLGNYESMHVELGVEDWVRDTDANTDAAMNRVFEFVETKLIEKVTELEKDLKQ